MTRRLLSLRLLILTAACVCAAGIADAQPASALAGIWSLNRAASQFPREIGFNTVPVPTDTDTPAATPSGGGSGRRGRRGSSGGSGGGAGGPLSGRRESYEDGQRIRLITEEARTPPARLMIVDNSGAIIITNELGQSRTLHPNGKSEPVEIQGIVFFVTTLRDGDRLVSVYQIEQDRQVRYIYSPAGTPARLTVEMEFLEHGEGDKVTRIYEAGTNVPAPPAVSSAAPASGAPASASQPGENFDQKPGAEFRGLKSLGVLVEDLGAESTACGLKRDVLEDALAKKLAASGLTVRRNSDDDTYVYVNIITNIEPSGTCVSRYDAFLYTHATARLAYHEQPVLVQVSLMHRGGIGASTNAGHAGAVSRGLEGYVDVFIAQIRDANK